MGSSQETDRQISQRIYEVLMRHADASDKLGEEIKDLRKEFAEAVKSNIRLEGKLAAMEGLNSRVEDHLDDAPKFKSDVEHRLRSAEESAARNSAKIAEKEREDALAIKARNAELEMLYDKLSASEKGSKIAIAVAIIEGLAIVAVALLK